MLVEGPRCGCAISRLYGSATGARVLGRTTAVCALSRLCLWPLPSLHGPSHGSAVCGRSGAPARDPTRPRDPTWRGGVRGRLDVGRARGCTCSRAPVQAAVQVQRAGCGAWGVGGTTWVCARGDPELSNLFPYSEHRQTTCYGKHLETCPSAAPSTIAHPHSCVSLASWSLGML